MIYWFVKHDKYTRTHHSCVFLGVACVCTQLRSSNEHWTIRYNSTAHCTYNLCYVTHLFASLISHTFTFNLWLKHQIYQNIALESYRATNASPKKHFLSRLIYRNIHNKDFGSNAYLFGLILISLINCNACAWHHGTKLKNYCHATGADDKKTKKLIEMWLLSDRFKQFQQNRIDLSFRTDFPYLQTHRTMSSTKWTCYGNLWSQFRLHWLERKCCSRSLMHS